MPTSIHFFYLKPCPSFRDRSKLKTFLHSLFRAEKKILGNLNYIFCSDDYLLKINQEYLKHDYYTDIITFDLSASAKSVEGEIYISVDRIRENARKEGVSVKEELHRVIFHGALHLCGYKDKAQKDKSEMKRRENRYLKGYL